MVFLRKDYNTSHYIRFYWVIKGKIRFPWQGYEGPAGGGRIPAGLV